MENLCWTGQRSGRRACCLKPLLVASPKWNFSKACKMHLSVPPLDLPVAFGATAPQALKNPWQHPGREIKCSARGGRELNFLSSKLRAQVKSCPLSTLEQNCCHRHVFFTLELGTSVLSISRNRDPGSSFSADCAFGHAAFCVHFPGLQMSRHYQVFSTWSLSHPPCHVLDTTKLPATVKLPGSPPTKYIGQHQQRIGFQVSNLHQWRPRLTRIIM